MSFNLENNPDFVGGLQALEQGQWARACAFFSGLRQSQPDTHYAAIEANLGRCSFEQGKALEALYFYQRANWIDRWSADYRKDLEIVEGSVARGAAAPPSGIEGAALGLVRWVRPGELVYMGGLFLLFACAIFYFRRKKRALWASFLALSFLVFGVGIWGLRADRIMVVVEEAKVRAAPLESLEGTITLNPGALVVRQKTSGEFVDVERSGLVRGWIKASQLRPVLSLWWDDRKAAEKSEPPLQTENPEN